MKKYLSSVVRFAVINSLSLANSVLCLLELGFMVSTQAVVRVVPQFCRSPT